ncbi:MAG: AAA family ATPase [Sulfuricellaceae bacterium]
MTFAIAPILQQAGVSQTDVYRACNLSRTVMSRIATHGEWPLLDASAPARIADYLASRGVAAALVQPIRDFVAPGKKMAPVVVEHAEADPAVLLNNPQEEDSMLLRNELITPEARRNFGLARNPFQDDVRTRADVFASAATRYARAALLDCAINSGFMALIGESGSGKSTLADELEQRIIDEQRPVIIIRPSVLSMEASDKAGKTLKSGQIAEAIIRTLAPGAIPRSSTEARDRQLRDMLISSRAAGFSHLVLIEEAHSLPVATLKHLKRFLEIKQGLGRLLGVALIGQPELHQRLSERSAEVREVVQRCEIVELRPLDNDLQAYIEHKFARVGAVAGDVLDSGVYDALRARLIRTPRGGTARDTLSICHPLVVNNLLARALNAAAGAGFAKVTADIVAGV